MTPVTCKNALIASTLLLICGMSFSAPPASAQSAKGGVVLDSNSSFWRVYYSLRAPVIRNGSQVTKLPVSTEDTPLPPKEWAQADFDDTMWTRVAGKPLLPKLGFHAAPEQAGAGITDAEGSSPSLAVLFMRGKFGVTDPSSVRDLKLSIQFHGGVIVYLNGTEVGRANMPKTASGPDALADDYPQEAFLKADGSADIKVPDRGGLDKATADVFKERVRSADITIPSKALRKGSNVLSIEIHRAPYNAGIVDWIQKKKISYSQLYGAIWATCELDSATLQSDSLSGLVPNSGRPKGFQIWNSQTLQPDFDLDYGDPDDTLRPIMLVGTRNAVCSGKVVVGCDQPIHDIKGVITELTGAKGGTISASNIQVRYAIADGEEPVLQDHYPVLANLFDGLAEVPPAVVDVSTRPKGAWSLGAVCPVWVTVSIPDNTPPGEYRGKLSITAQGFKSDVAVQLTVCNYSMPKPSEFHTVLDIMQSPETVAMEYNVPLWSDKHFKLLEKSLDRAGYIGSWDLHIPLICQTNLGNEESMVRWIPQPGGTYKYDFMPLEKYLDLADKHMGKPRCVDLVVWDLFLGFSGLEEAPTFLVHNTTLPKGFQPQDVPVSMLDEATGKVTMGTVGRYDDKGKANWKALTDQLMVILKKHGLEKTIHLGHSYDLCPTDAMATFWNDLLPGVHWMRYGHYEYRTFGKTPYGISDFITHEWAPTWSQKPQYGWKNPVIDIPWMRLQSERNLTGGYWKADPYVSMPTDMFRTWGEICIQGPYRGFGRMGLDFWPVLENERGVKNTVAIQGRFPNSSWRQSDEMIVSIVPPGPDGALSSSKLEMIREDMQDTEARIFLENALLTEKSRLSGALAAKAQAVLDAHVRALQMALERQSIAGFNPAPEMYLDGYSYSGMYAMIHGAIFHQWFMESGWQKRSQDTFDVAGEVQAALGH